MSTIIIRAEGPIDDSKIKSDTTTDIKTAIQAIIPAAKIDISYRTESDV